jgi:hypothetical protein
MSDWHRMDEDSVLRRLETDSGGAEPSAPAAQPSHRRSAWPRDGHGSNASSEADKGGVLAFEGKCALSSSKAPIGAGQRHLFSTYWMSPLGFHKGESVMTPCTDTHQSTAMPRRNR